MSFLGMSAVLSLKPEHHLTILSTALHSPVLGFPQSRRYLDVEANDKDEGVPAYTAPPAFTAPCDVDEEQVAYNEVTTPWKEDQEMYFQISAILRPVRAPYYHVYLAMPMRYAAMMSRSLHHLQILAAVMCVGCTLQHDLNVHGDGVLRCTVRCIFEFC